MKKFKFQLAAVLKVSQIKKEQAEIKFAEATQFLNQQIQILCTFESELNQGMEDYYHLAASLITIDKLMSYSGYFDRMRMQIERQKREITLAEKNKQEALAILKVAMNKLKSLEQLYDKRFAEFRSQQLFEEQKELDEIGLQIYTRVVR